MHISENIVQLIGHVGHHDNFVTGPRPSCPTRYCIFLFGKKAQLKPVGNYSWCIIYK